MFHLNVIEESDRPAETAEPSLPGTSSDMVVDASANATVEPTVLAGDPVSMSDQAPAPVEAVEAPPAPGEAVEAPVTDEVTDEVHHDLAF